MDNFVRGKHCGLLRRGPGLSRKGAAVFLAVSLLIPGPAARAVEFEIAADSFTVVNQVNLSSVTYFQTRASVPPDPALATQLLTPGGLYFDATYYNVWDRTALNWVKLATGTVEAGRVAKAGDFMNGQLTTASTITVQGNAFSVGASTFVVIGGNVGVGTASPASALHVLSPTSATYALIIATGAATSQYIMTLTTSGVLTAAGGMTGGGVPAGTVAFFNLAVCPAGWTELTSARGRYLVGLPAAGTLAGTAGTALSNLEDRPVGQHLHNITDPSHSHGIPSYSSAGGYNTYQALAGQSDTFLQINTEAKATGITINNSGTVGGTNAPYLQLLVCSCTGPGMCQSGGSASSAVAATNLAGGAANQVPFQTGPSATTFTASPGANAVLFADSGAPTWTNAPTLTGTNFTGIPDGALSANVGLLTGAQTFSGAKTFSEATAFPGSGIWNATGNVGIGTTAPASKLHVLDGDIRVSTSAGQPDKGIVFQDGSIQTTAAGGTGGGWTDTGSVVQLVTPTDTIGSTGAGVTVSTHLIVSAGNVGIGTTSPATLLDVAGAAQFGSGVAKSTFTAAGRLTFPTGYSPTVALEAATKGYVDSSVGSASPLLASTNTWSAQQTFLNQLTISTGATISGNVGIGTTSPGTILVVKGDANAQTPKGKLMVIQDTNGDWNTGLGLYPKFTNAAQRGWSMVANSIAGGELVFYVGSNSSSEPNYAGASGAVMTLNKDGNVGIGTVSPGAKLEVAGQIQFRSPAMTGSEDLFLKSAAAAAALNAGTTGWGGGGVYAFWNDAAGQSCTTKCTNTGKTCGAALAVHPNYVSIPGCGYSATNGLACLCY